VAQFGRFDPLIPSIIRDYMRYDWWRHLVVSIPLAWWMGWLALKPYLGAVVRLGLRPHRARAIAAVAVQCLAGRGLDALIGNHYTR
jgi:hypothetical protein